jgi:hypothetical protein
MGEGEGGGGEPTPIWKKASLLVLVRSAEVSSWEVASSICFWKLEGIQIIFGKKEGGGDWRLKLKKEVHVPRVWLQDETMTQVAPKAICNT